MVALEKEITAPRKLYYVRQIKHYLDVDKCPRWKQFIFYYLYRPLVMFVQHRLKLPVLMKLDADGKPCWEERQCFCETKEEADEMIAGKRWWSHVELYENVPLPPETCVVGSQVEIGRNKDEVHIRKDWPLWAVKQSDKYMQNAVLREARSLRERLEQRHL